VGGPLTTQTKPLAAGLAGGLARLVPILLLASCAGRLPVVVPPPAGVDAVAGYASASIEGEEMALKGKFAFLFRRPGAGRVDVSGPFGSTLYFLLFDKDTAYLVVPRKKTYAEEKPESLMGRFLGFSLHPDELLRLLSGDWRESRESLGEPAWRLGRDESGRVVVGERDGFRFEIPEFFPGAGVPRILVFSAPGTSGRIRLLTVRFNPAPRPEALAADFLRSFHRRSWEEIQEILRNED
jgi:hypothetical protein